MLYFRFGTYTHYDLWQYSNNIVQDASYIGPAGSCFYLQDLDNLVSSSSNPHILWRYLIAHGLPTLWDSMAVPIECHLGSWRSRYVATEPLCGRPLFVDVQRAISFIPGSFGSYSISVLETSATISR